MNNERGIGRSQVERDAFTVKFERDVWPRLSEEEQKRKSRSDLYRKVISDIERGLERIHIAGQLGNHDCCTLALGEAMRIYNEISLVYPHEPKFIISSSGMNYDELNLTVIDTTRDNQ